MPAQPEAAPSTAEEQAEREEEAGGGSLACSTAEVHV